MRLSILLLSLVWAGAAHAAVEHVPITSNVNLKSGEAQAITVEATGPTEIGWRAVQTKPCTTDCVQATDVTGGISYTIATRLGASMKYTPAAGKITIEYRNVSGEPVTINVYRVHRTCEAEACSFSIRARKAAWSCSRSMNSADALRGPPPLGRPPWWIDPGEACAYHLGAAEYPGGGGQT